MNHGNGTNHIEPGGNTGVDPETDTNDIRAILDAGGKGAGILAQRGALLEWAEKAGRRYRESFWIAEARIGGARTSCLERCGMSAHLKSNLWRQFWENSSFSGSRARSRDSVGLFGSLVAPQQIVRSHHKSLRYFGNDKRRYFDSHSPRAALG